MVGLGGLATPFLVVWRTPWRLSGSEDVVGGLRADEDEEAAAAMDWAEYGIDLRGVGGWLANMEDWRRVCG